MKDKGCRPWLSVITGGESLVLHAGGVLLVETARRSGLAKELSARCRAWWVQRFTPLLIDAARPCWHAPGDRWFTDETYVPQRNSPRRPGGPSLPLTSAVALDAAHRRKVTTRRRKPSATMARC